VKVVICNDTDILGELKLSYHPNLRNDLQVKQCLNIVHVSQSFVLISTHSTGEAVGVAGAKLARFKY
jgi:hypothetical protein